MGEHLDIVVSRFRNMLDRIRDKDPDFDDLCAHHAEVTREIRGLNPDVGNWQRFKAGLEEDG